MHAEGAKHWVSAVTDSLPSPIKVMALAHGAIIASAVRFMCSGTLRNACSFVGIGLVLFQLTSEWNWLAGAPW
jgi:hypothetical protein